MDAAVPAIIVLLVVCVAACFDLWLLMIPNMLTLPFLITGIAYQSIMGGRAGLQSSVMGALLGFGVLMLPYLCGGMGAGDVKLMAGVGAWVGVSNIVHILLTSSLAAGVYAVVLILMYGRAREVCLKFWFNWFRFGRAGKRLYGEETVETEMRRADRRQRLIPFAAMVALGVLATLAWPSFIVP